MNRTNLIPHAKAESGQLARYTSPRLVCYGHVADLTAAGSGGNSEQSGNAVNCAKKKAYVPQCMGLG